MTAVAKRAARRVVNDSAPRPTMERIRVLVVDDHPAVLRGLRELLGDQPDCQVIAAVRSAQEALSVAEREDLDVAVVDYQLDGRSGLWVTRKLKRLPRPPRVVIYSAYCDGVLAAAAVVAEADGLVSKGGPGSDLCEAVRGVARGRSWFPTVPWRLGEVMRRRLSAEEQAIFGMSLAGMVSAEIAQTLGISATGLESVRWEMLRKLETIDWDLTSTDRERKRSGVAAWRRVTHVPAH